MSQSVAVVVQTHWDREWYYPHQTFLARLLQVMEQVVEQLDAGELTSFLFDGQVSAIDDFYTAAEPELAARVQDYVRQGKIVIGPWYIMADEFLCAGESLIRNLELGRTRADELGQCQNVGYLPDTFGHISQMPQILKGFGIDNAVAWRGIDHSESEMIWQAADGSEVFTVFLTEGYYQHPFNTDNWQRNLTTYLDKIATRSTGQRLLLTQGGDHLLTREGLQTRIQEFNQGQNTYQLEQQRLEDYVNELKGSSGQLGRLTGELRGNDNIFVLPDVLSTRQYLKQANQHIEDRLTGLIEPLLAIAPLARYPEHYLRQTWKLLIEQHAHDSICGCSVDEVHEEMQVRFKQLNQRLDALQKQAQLALGLSNNRMTKHREQGLSNPFADDSRFSLFNPSPKPVSGWQPLSLFLAGEEAQMLTITDNKGNTLPCTVISSEPTADFHSPIDDFPDQVSGIRYQVLLKADLDGLELKPLNVEADRQSVAGPTNTETTYFENAYYRIEPTQDGKLQFTDKQSQKRYDNWLSLTSELDAGDSYNFSPVDGVLRHSQITRVRQCRHWDNGLQQLVLEITLTQPASLNDDRQGAHDKTVDSQGQLCLTLLPDRQHIDVSLSWHNRAQDQRLRINLPLGERVAHSYADSAFDWVKRPKVYFDDAPVSGMQETPVAVNPSYSAIKAGRLGVMQRGLQEFELVGDEHGDTLAVTLLRSVGWLSRRDLSTRGQGAGPDLATPQAQCLGQYEFHFALLPGDPTPTKLLNQARQFRQPVAVLRGHSEHQAPQVQLHSPELQITSCRRVKDHLEVRLWNPQESEVKADFGTQSVTRTDLNGDPLPLSLVVQPKQIATFTLKLGANQ
ncbi:Alpha-mannosidase [Saliniradius amylolyticus]|uniref:Alpha-mannosidase n=1 Tax=Saliniradius amylolyticus TaxID=2183582 RepID=A0A2S2E4R5_9ALTE|nr:glycoside hydrolase family 38 C-terminal domain-containing protein [Saliniradius amylolyticus]AWL11987.1 Alpha-mannosidase [Saliniradius amylolyticus]